MLDFLVAIMFEDLLEVGIAAGFGALVVPVDGLELFHQRDDGAVQVEGFRGQVFFVQAFARHGGSFALRKFGRCFLCCFRDDRCCGPAPEDTREETAFAHSSTN